MKTSDNTHISELDRIQIPATSTSIDRYVFANSWTKGKIVLDAATGYGFGAGILLSLGALRVTGVDLDVIALKDAGDRFMSTHLAFEKCDIFNLEEKYGKNSFEVCTSIETFEHLPPDRIDEYLQQLRTVTTETIIITTPKRKTPTWEFDGGTHLYEYDPQEFGEVLNRNFPNDDISVLGIVEIPLRCTIAGVPQQWGSTLVSDLNEAWVMMSVIHLNKEDNG